MDLSNMDLSGLLSTFGIGGALVWYMYYTTSVAQPKLHEHYSKILTDLTKEFTTELKAERASREASARERQCLLSPEQLQRIRNGGNG